MQGEFGPAFADAPRTPTISGATFADLTPAWLTAFLTRRGNVTAGRVLQNNGGNDLAIGGNGAFTFTTKLANGSINAVTVQTQPGGQTCTVANVTGTIAGADVTNVTVTCENQKVPLYLAFVARN